MRNFFAFSLFFLAFFAGLAFLMSLPQFFLDVLTLIENATGVRYVPTQYLLVSIASTFFFLLLAIVLFRIGLKLTKSAR